MCIRDSLLTGRREQLVPLLRKPCRGGSFDCDGDTLRVCWTFEQADGSAPVLWQLLLYVGASDNPAIAPPAGKLIHSQACKPNPDGSWHLARGAVIVTSGEPDHV